MTSIIGKGSSCERLANRAPSGVTAWRASKRIALLESLLQRAMQHARTCVIMRFILARAHRLKRSSDALELLLLSAP